MTSAWFETFFRGVAAEFWIRAIPPAHTISEVDFLEKSLVVKPGARLLDIPCGAGRHAIELARRGYTVSGVDLSEDFLDAGRIAAADAGVKVEFRRGDMRRFSVKAGAFDGAFCFGNSFGYLNSTDAGAFLATVARALTAGGRLVIDTGTAAESILPALVARRWHRLGDLVVLSECRYTSQESRLDIDYTFVQGGSAETRPASSYVFTVGELRRMLDRAGFRVVGMSGGVSGEAFQLGSPRLLIVAVRR
jgi:SAM-dependent methyltransferase